MAGMGRATADWRGEAIRSEGEVSVNDNPDGSDRHSSMTPPRSSAFVRVLSAGWFQMALLPLLALAGMALFLAYAAAGGAPGFPLDDAWIHQTYARNLAQTGQLAYLPGAPSAGSTAPLWTLLLSIGYRLGLPYRLWTLCLGWLALTLTGWFAARLAGGLFPGRPRVASLVGLACVAEWHLVWAAVSGMETVLFCALALALLSLGLEAESKPWRGLGLGLLAGALILTRPEGALLVALVALNPYARAAQARRRPAGATLGHSLGLAGGCLLLLAPYVYFNLRHSGTLLPNTFYAKQVEYATMIAGWSLPARWARVVSPTLIGAQALLLPGFLWAAWSALRGAFGRWAGRPAAGAPASGLPLLYWAIFTLVYATRLPVSYQHGRYLMPTIPLLIALGAGGTAALLERWRAAERRRLVAVALTFAAALLLAGFLVIGAGGYATDVAYINGEMVDTAQWIAAHAPADALIAAHDIGALGYFAGRPLLDLAGLISPEIIPIMHDGPALLADMQARRAQYLIIFPEWYPTLAQSPALEMVYQTDCAVTRAAGQQNMAVYRVSAPAQ